MMKWKRCGIVDSLVVLEEWNKVEQDYGGIWWMIGARWRERRIEVSLR